MFYQKKKNIVYKEYKKLITEYKQAEETTPETVNKETSKIDVKSEYEKYIDSIYKDKEKLKEEAELKGIDVKGKSRKQVRDILLGKTENFKLETLPEEKQIMNAEEERKKRIAIIENMTWQKLQSEAKAKGIKYQKGIKQPELKKLLIDNIVIN